MSDRGTIGATMHRAVVVVGATLVMALGAKGLAFLLDGDFATILAFMALTWAVDEWYATHVKRGPDV